jgi:minimal PKS acyl carrier protein
MSKTMTIEDLHRILIACAGGDVETPDGDISRVSFEELGYDSLVLIETAAVLKRDHGVDLPDDEVSGARTPSELLDRVNDRIRALS